MPYPITIAYNSFSAPQYRADNVPNNDTNAPGGNTASITGLLVEGAAALAGTVVQQQSFDTIPDPLAWQPLAAGAAGRFPFAPHQDLLKISLQLGQPALINEIIVELFEPGNAQPIWQLTLDRNANVANWGNSIHFYFDGNLAQNGLPGGGLDAGAGTAVQGQVTGSPNDPNGYPNDHANARHAPYMLRARISQIGANTKVDTASRYVFLDVMIHDISFGLASPDFVRGPAQENERRTYDCTRAAYDELAHDLNANAWGMGERFRAITGGPRNLHLPTNSFSRSSYYFEQNAIYYALSKLYGNGPGLPLVAEIRLRRFNGQAADLQQAAPGLAGLWFQWDWDGDANSNCALRGNPPQQADVFVNASYDYKPNEWAHAARNCHVDHGGKRGVQAATNQTCTFFRALMEPANVNNPVDNTLPRAAGGNALFPFAAPANRVWAGRTQAITDPNNAQAGCTGVIFEPSFIAGDAYTLKLAADYTGGLDTADVNAYGQQLQNNVQANAADSLTVWHSFNLLQFLYKSPQVRADDVDFGYIATQFGYGHIRFVPPVGNDGQAANRVNLAQLDYETALTQTFADLPPAMQILLEGADVQPAALGNPVSIQFNVAGHYAQPHGLLIRSYDDYRQAMLDWIAAHRQAIVAGNHGGSQQALTTYFETVLQTNQLSMLDMAITDPAWLGHDDVWIGKRMKNSMIADFKSKYGGTIRPGWGSRIFEILATKLVRNQMGVAARPDPGISLIVMDFLDPQLDHEGVAVAITTRQPQQQCEYGHNLAVWEPLVYWSDDPEKANRQCPTCHELVDETATVLSYVPLECMRGQNSPYWGNMTTMDKLSVWAGNKYHTHSGITLTHEIGHQMGLCHSPPNPKVLFITIKETAGANPALHDRDDQACIMSYNISQTANMHFCGYCLLRMRGWSIGPSANTPDLALLWALDQDDVVLHNRGQDNTAP